MNYKTLACHLLKNTKKTFFFLLRIRRIFILNIYKRKNEIKNMEKSIDNIIKVARKIFEI